MAKVVQCVNSKTGEVFNAKVYTVKEQINYAAQRSKKGTLDRNGKPLSNFRRGQYLGKAQGMSNGARMAKNAKYKVKSVKK